MAAKVDGLLSDLLKRRQGIDKALRGGRLTADQSRWLDESYCFVVKEDTNPVLGFGRSGAAELNTADDDSGVIWFTTTKLLKDRDGDVVVPTGRHGENYERSPVWFFGHQEWEIPIGTSWEDGPGSPVMVEVYDDRIRQGCKFDRADPDADYLYGKVKRGYLNSTSIAFIPIVAHRLDEVEKARHQNHPGVPPGWYFAEWDHTETSLVGLGSNQEALRDSIDQEKGWITPRLYKGLTTFAARPRGRCFSGYCPPVRGKRKGMGGACGCKDCQEGHECPCEKDVNFGGTQGVAEVGTQAGEIDRTKAGRWFVVDESGQDIDGPFTSQGQAEASKTYHVSGPLRRHNLRVVERGFGGGTEATFLVKPEEYSRFYNDARSAGLRLLDREPDERGNVNVLGSEDAVAGLRGRWRLIGPPELRRSMKALPSEEADVTPEKACTILRDGEVHGKPLTEAQRGMFGAICGRKKGWQQLIPQAKALLGKQLTTTSGTAGGYTVHSDRPGKIQQDGGKGSTETATDTEGHLVCMNCNGDGNCPHCGGKGEEVAGAICRTCDGSGDCQECGGVGHKKKRLNMRTNTKRAPVKKQADDDHDADDKPKGDDYPAGNDPGSGMPKDPNLDGVDGGGGAGTGDTATKGAADEPFTPMPSAVEIAKLYSHLKEMPEYIENALKEMDHPKIREGLTSFSEKYLQKAMDYLNKLMDDNHGNGEQGYMDKVLKAMEADDTPQGATVQPGEAGQIDIGNIPPSSDGDVAGTTSADGGGTSQGSTDEILERYQDEKGYWRTKSHALSALGLRKTADGKLYLVKQNNSAPDSRSQVTGSGKPDKDANQGDANNPMKSFGPYVEMVGNASEFLKECADDEEAMPSKSLRTVAKSHGNFLGQVHKALTSAGKVQHDGGGGSVLTDEGTAGNRGSMKDRGEVETSHGTPGREIIQGGGARSPSDGPDGTSRSPLKSALSPVKKGMSGGGTLSPEIVERFNKMCEHARQYGIPVEPI